MCVEYGGEVMDGSQLTCAGEGCQRKDGVEEERKWNLYSSHGVDAGRDCCPSMGRDEVAGEEDLDEDVTFDIVLAAPDPISTATVDHCAASPQCV